MVEIHILNVGFGNMALIIKPDNSTMVIDCNITKENHEKVIGYLTKIIGQNKAIDTFINTHRDADHMRGISTLHKNHPIKVIRDSNVPGTTTTSLEYMNYMSLRRNSKVTASTIKARTKIDDGDFTIRFLNSSWDDYNDANDQSVVVKIEYKGSSVLFPGDTSYKPWKEKILPFYGDSKLSSSILIASHHGSDSFFNDPNDTKHWYVDHIRKISPDMTLVSVGNNTHDLPDSDALKLYEKYSSGSDKGNKIYTTQKQGTMRIRLKTDNSWSMALRQ